MLAARGAKRLTTAVPSVAMPQDLTKISRLLAEGRPPATPVAVGRDGVHTFADLRGHVAALTERITAAGPGRRR